MRHFIVIVLVFASISGIQPLSAQTTAITEGNIQIGYIIPGICGSFSPDSTLLGIPQMGVYDLATGEQKFPFLVSAPQINIEDDRTEFSSDGRYVLVPGDGVYDVESGERLFTLWRDAIFSPDSRFVAIMTENDAVQMYDLQQQAVHFQIDRVATLGRNAASFSLDNRWVGISYKGVYDLATGEQVIRNGVGGGIFSPDNQYVMSGATGGVYMLPSGEQIAHISIAAGNFNSDSTLVAASEGVYSLPSGDKLFSIDHKKSLLSPDGQYLLVDDDGIYRVDTWERVLDGEFNDFSPDSQWAIVQGFSTGSTTFVNIESGQRQDLPFRSVRRFSPDVQLAINTGSDAYDLYTFKRRFVETGYGFFSPDGLYMVVPEFGDNRQNYCVVYSMARDGWETRHTLVHAEQVNVRESPNEQASVIGSGSGDWLVIDQTSDNQWHKVRGGRNLFGWAAASVLTVIHQPSSE
jgi:hypothetical protein